MSDSSIISFECPDCHGLIEMPPPGSAPERLQCPYCGRNLQPHPPSRLSAKRIAILTLVLCLLGGAGAMMAMLLKRATTSPVEPITITEPAVASTTTNGFSISGLAIESHGTLRYVQGTARNDRTEQRFGVTVQFQLLDTNELRVGSASDYRAVIQSNEVWKFRALVVEPKAVAATLHAITEAQ